MKKSELRIGNYFRHYNEWSYRQPDNGPFNEFDFQWEERDWFAIGESCLNLEKIKPIPLTEEWFLKFGFEKEQVCAPGIAEWDEFYLNKVTISAIGVNMTGYKFGGGDTPLVDVRYVHQLQNLYFALTGTELEIKS